MRKKRKREGIPGQSATQCERDSLVSHTGGRNKRMIFVIFIFFRLLRLYQLKERYACALLLFFLTVIMNKK